MANTKAAQPRAAKKPTGFDAVVKERLVPVNNGFGSWDGFLFGEFNEVGQKCLNMADHLTLDEALERAKLDWSVGLWPMFTKAPDGTMVEVLGHGVTVREDTREPLAPVGPGYQVVQTREAFSVARALDVVTQGQGNFIGMAPVRDGRQVAAIYALPPLEIGEDEEVLPVVLVWTSHDGTKAVEVTFVPVRLACWNGNLWHVKGSSSVYRVKHTGRALDRLSLEVAGKALSEGSKFFAAWLKQAKAANRKKLSQKAVDDFLEKLTHPLDKDGNVVPFVLPKQQKAATIAEVTRDTILAKYQNSPNVQNLPYSAYRMLQAVSEYVDHERRTRVVDDARYGAGSRPVEEQEAELRWLRSVGRHDLKDKAVSLLLG